MTDPRPDPFENDEPDVEIPAETVRWLVASLRGSVLRTTGNADLGRTISETAAAMLEAAAALDGFL